MYAHIQKIKISIKSKIANTTAINLKIVITIFHLTTHAKSPEYSSKAPIILIGTFFD